jgi:Na+-transporting methylmalonyl-CoA/oxaloacetate decarboxylase beta subunit
MEIIQKMLTSCGFSYMTLSNAVMILVGLTAIFIAIKKEYEPLLLVPIGFGIVVGNMPYMPTLLIGVYDSVKHQLMPYLSTEQQTLLYAYHFLHKSGNAVFSVISISLL